jgi:hypothetical protein
MAKKSTKLELTSRVKKVSQWILAGEGTTDIIDLSREQWKVTIRQAYRYLKLALVEVYLIGKDELKERQAFHVKERLDLFIDAKKQKQTMPALAILDSIAKLEALFVQKIDHTTKGDKIETTVFYLPENGRNK